MSATKTNTASTLVLSCNQSTPPLSYSVILTSQVTKYSPITAPVGVATLLFVQPTPVSAVRPRVLWTVRRTVQVLTENVLAQSLMFVSVKHIDLQVGKACCK